MLLTAEHPQSIQVPDEALSVAFMVDKETGTAIVTADWVLLRKCVEPEPAHEDWGEEESLLCWLEGWSYRKSHEIEGSTAGAQTDYQI